MRLVFMGTPAAAVPSLEAAARAHEVAFVVCRPDRERGRGRRVSEPPVKAAAAALSLRVVQPETTRSPELRAALEQARPDVLVVVAYGRVLGPKTLATARLGAVNVHFSLLPRWRGAAPVQRAMLAGDAETGVSTMRLVEELDAGPVFEQASTPIRPDEHAPALEDRLSVLGADLLLRTLDGLEGGALEARAQDESLATWAPPLEKAEGSLDPACSAELLARRVRALDPWPGTWLSRAGGGDLAVLDAAPAEDVTTVAPGTVLAPRGEDALLACGSGTVLRLSSVRPAGRAVMTGRAAVSGRFLAPGEVLVAGVAPPRPPAREEAS